MKKFKFLLILTVAFLYTQNISAQSRVDRAKRSHENY